MSYSPPSLPVIWMPSYTGRPIDLVNPIAQEVDFAEIAHALSLENRFGGNTQKPISVALHTLIGCALAPDNLVALFALHDAAEARLGDRLQPEKSATYQVACEMFGTDAADMIERVRKELESRHDRAIHQAAGLEIPTPEQKAALRRIDLMVLAIEKRDFHVPQQLPWMIDAIPDIQPSCPPFTWMPPEEAEAELLALFKRHLPALNGKMMLAA
ncbi:hypothetical protein [Microvirga tunisiensis]|uniref:HD domain-containing protein n=1 Tax=Microvirga tunisiensis TaxID=2108360 RepID=A0A5N7MSU7_9HYPH|nr:hypothetical protein [Microvirga tunisiensis]MPR11724.1 hypothetical protein [Microvirga tunisiensis]MPR29720.1 hypothetical protein [Microvirga tunisiensis]